MARSRSVWTTPAYVCVRASLERRATDVRHVTTYDALVSKESPNKDIVGSDYRHTVR